MEKESFILNNLAGSSLRIARELGDQVSLKELVEALLRIWANSFPDQDLSFAELSSEDGVLQIYESELLRGSLSDDMNESLRMIPLNEINYCNLHFLKVGSLDRNLFFIGFEESPLGVFWWDGLETVENRALQQIIMGQVAIFSRWCSRFQQAQNLMHRDDLTGLYNFRYLEACLESEINRVQRFETKFSLLFIDLDNFKPVNDQYGHLSGSSVLKQLANLLRHELRDVDSIFRYGGDEFVVLLVETDAQKAFGVGDRLREKIEQHRFVVSKQKGIHITASIGIASCPDHSASSKELLSLADECMYKSKRAGKNKVAILEKSGSSTEEITEKEMG